MLENILALEQRVGEAETTESFFCDIIFNAKIKFHLKCTKVVREHQEKT